MLKTTNARSGAHTFLGREFLVGLVLGMSLGTIMSPSRAFLIPSLSDQTAFGGGEWEKMTMNTTSLLEAIVERDARIATLERDCVGSMERTKARPSSRAAYGEESEVGGEPKRSFPQSTSSFLKAMARVHRKEFSNVFDYGLPENPETENTEVLLIYNTEKSIPSSLIHGNNESAAGPLLSVHDATSKCGTLSVVSIGNPTDFNHRNVGTQCLALVRDNPMYHIPRFTKQRGHFELRMRDVLKLNNRGTYNEYTFENEKDGTPTHKHREFLRKYLTNFDATTSKLSPILDQISVHNTVVVMVCNYGQSSLLLNFVCACHAKAISTANWIVFATDKETVEIVQSLDLTVFHDEGLFGHIPTEAAANFRDQTFTNVVTAKIVASHLVSFLGYDLLYQDVDIVYYKDPLQLFHAENSLSKFDVMFANDGGKGVYFYPFTANTGFFYARYNDRTRHLFRSWLFAMDTVWRHDDQVAMNTVLPEEMSLTGLKVKTLSMDEFPCGFRFHRHPEFMNKLVANKTDTYIFHMNWNRNHTEKLKQMKQVGIWYAKDDCIGSKGVQLLDGRTSVVENCCSANPLGGPKQFQARTPSVRQHRLANSMMVINTLK